MVRWIVVGWGRAGRVHAAALGRTPGATVAAVVTSVPDAAGSAPAPVHPDLATAVAAARPDAVVVATPDARHAELVRTCLELGLPVLCEKPVGVSAAESRALLAHAGECGGAVGVVLNQRGQRHNRWVRERIATGDLRPCSIAVTGHLARLAGWHDRSAGTGRGVVRTVGLHYVDLARWWMGGLDVQGATCWGDRGAETVAHALLRGPSGEPVSIVLSAGTAAALQPVRIVIDGDTPDGAARLVLDGHRLTHVSGLPEPPPVEPADPGLPFGPGHLAVAAEATAALAEGRPFPISLAEAMESLELIDRIAAAGQTLAPDRVGQR